MSKTFYDLTKNERITIKEAEERHARMQVQRDIAEIKDALKAMCAMTMGMMIGGGNDKNLS